MKQLILIISIVLCPLLLMAQKLTPADVYNPQTRCATCWVSDVNHTLSDDTRRYIDNRLSTLNAQLGVQIAVVIIPGIQGDDEYDFAYRLFNHWGIGRQGYNDGLLFLYVEDIRAMKFETGYALEGLLPDAYLDGLLNETIFPLMRTGNVNQAFTAAVDRITDRLTTEQAREELLLNTATPRITAVNTIAWYLIIGFIILILAAINLYFVTRRLHGDNNVRYASLRHTSTLTAIFACIFPIPMIFMWLYVRSIRRAQRHRPLTCHKCGGTMRLLSEQEEDTYLNFRQQAEERLKSVDYDVWKCNVCDEIRILPYEKINSKYTTCPRCGAKTYALISDDIVVPASTLSSGQGQKVHTCANCGLRKIIPYVIPIIIIPKSSGSGGFGSGGGFGGGMSGGGGAGGRF